MPDPRQIDAPRTEPRPSPSIHDLREWAEEAAELGYSTVSVPPGSLLALLDRAAAPQPRDDLRAAVETVRRELAELGSDVVQDHRGIPYDISRRIDDAHDALAAALRAEGSSKPSSIPDSLVGVDPRDYPGARGSSKPEAGKP